MKRYLVYDRSEIWKEGKLYVMDNIYDDADSLAHWSTPLFLFRRIHPYFTYSGNNCIDFKSNSWTQSNLTGYNLTERIM